MRESRLLSGKDITDLLSEMGARLSKEGKVAEVAIFGGSAIAMTFDFRDSTYDVDYMPISGDLEAVRRCAQSVANDFNLPDDWFNDAVEIFKSDDGKFNLHGEYPADRPGIRVFTATPQYILSMKVMAMRNSMESIDCLDIWNLVDAIGVETAEEAICIVAGFYPDREVPIRNRLILEDLFVEKTNGRPYSALIGF